MPAPKEQPPPRSDELVDHTVIIFVHPLQFFLEVVQEKYVVVLFQRTKELLVSLICSNVHSRSLLQFIFNIVVDYVGIYSRLFELKVFDK